MTTLEFQRRQLGLCLKTSAAYRRRISVYALHDDSDVRPEDLLKQVVHWIETPWRW